MYIFKEISLTCTHEKHFKEQGKNFKIRCAKDLGPAITSLQLKSSFSAVVNQKYSTLA